MGMFDHVKVRLPLPADIQDMVFQSKDFECDLAEYELRPEGIFRTSEGVLGEVDSAPPHRYVLEVYFYTHDKDNVWRSFKVKYAVGPVVDGPTSCQIPL